MEMLNLQDKSFKKAIILSVSVHLGLFILLVISPYLPKPARRGMVHYVNVISLGGGGGGGGRPGGGGGGGSSAELRSEESAATALPKRESLRDLTTPQRLEQTKPPALSYPVEKPKADKKTSSQKKAVIAKSKPDAAANEKSQSQPGSGEGTGPRVGIGVGDGSGGGGFGFGSEYSSQIGLSNFPFTYYLQAIHSRISNNWHTSLIRTGSSGDIYVTVKFRIYKNGQISEPEVIESSQSRTMDSSAIRAIRNSAPFPPLPREYEDEYLVIRLIFEHSR